MYVSLSPLLLCFFRSHFSFTPSCMHFFRSLRLFSPLLSCFFSLSLSSLSPVMSLNVAIYVHIFCLSASLLFFFGRHEYNIYALHSMTVDEQIGHINTKRRYERCLVKAGGRESESEEEAHLANSRHTTSFFCASCHICLLIEIYVNL